MKDNVLEIDNELDVHYKWRYLYDLYIRPMSNSIKYKKLSDNGIAPKK